MGQGDECEAFIARAHQTFLDRGDREGAARAAFWLGFASCAAAPWPPPPAGSPELNACSRKASSTACTGYLLIPTAILRIVQGDPSAAHAIFSQAAEIARRFGDRDLASVACHGSGRALIRLGNILEGVARLDEAMASVIAGEVTSLVAGDVSCSVLEAARRLLICVAHTNGRARLRGGVRPSPTRALSRRVSALSRRGHAVAGQLGQAAQ